MDRFLVIASGHVDAQMGGLPAHPTPAAGYQRDSASGRIRRADVDIQDCKVEVPEGRRRGDPLVIEFPDKQPARSWHASAACQRILRLRTDNAGGDVILADGVPAGQVTAGTARSGP